ncbi:MAG TPA: cupin domain-containing protein [Solirubrobacteraceae bacterium]|nr:cupin domain-containing protein [Solirubrobacteraceae bacterium]
MARPNVYDSEFPMAREEIGVRGRRVASAAGARELGGTVYELAPGARGVSLHAHYGNEELFVVLEGSPTLRTLEGDEELRKGDVVACVRGREGTHTFVNRSSEPALLLAISTANMPDVAVYPESDTIGVVTRHPFDPVPEGGDEGIIAVFSAEDNQRPKRR